MSLVIRCFDYLHDSFNLVHHNDDDSRTVEFADTPGQMLMRFDSSTNIWDSRGHKIGHIGTSGQDFVLELPGKVEQAKLGPHKDWHWIELEKAECRAAQMFFDARLPEWVFSNLVVILEEDNGGMFHPTPEQRARALPAIDALVKAGFFMDEPADITGSFWQAAAGEESERKEFFSKCSDAFATLESVLEDIFEGSSEEPTSINTPKKGM